MTDQHQHPDSQDEQQSPGQSPVEQEIRENAPNSHAPRDGIAILGYSMSVVLVAVFALFLIGVALVLLLS